MYHYNMRPKERARRNVVGMVWGADYNKADASTTPVYHDYAALFLRRCGQAMRTLYIRLDLRFELFWDGGGSHISRT